MTKMDLVLAEVNKGAETVNAISKNLRLPYQSTASYLNRLKGSDKVVHVNGAWRPVSKCLLAETWK